MKSVSLPYTLTEKLEFEKQYLPDKGNNGDSTVQAVPCKDSDYNLPGVLKNNPLQSFRVPIALLHGSQPGGVASPHIVRVALPLPRWGCLPSAWRGALPSHA